jgi:hypothetical protein
MGPGFKIQGPHADKDKHAEFFTFAHIQGATPDLFSEKENEVFFIYFSFHLFRNWFCRL